LYTSRAEKSRPFIRDRSEKKLAPGGGGGYNRAMNKKRAGKAGLSPENGRK
jgi:hypothetical protein